MYNNNIALIWGDIIMSKKIIFMIFTPIIIMFSLTSCTAKEKIVNKVENQKIAEVEIKISEEELEKQISSSILATAERYKPGELSTEAHKTLGTNISNNKLTAYVVASVSNYAFENNKFTVTSGSGCIPTVIEYEINTNNRFKELKYLEPEDGHSYISSVKSLFPAEYENAALEAQSFAQTLNDTMNEYAKSYLISINRNADIVDFQEKKLLDFPVNAIKELSNYPDWIGSTERIEDNNRYIYSVSQSSLNGENVFEFTKRDTENTIIESFTLNDEGKFIK